MKISKGIIYMFYATFLFALMNLFVKMLPRIPAVEIVFFRSLITLVMSGSMLTIQRKNLWGNNKKLLIGRGLTGAVALILYFYTLQEIPLASAVTFQFITPIFTAILGVFLLKEKVFSWQWFFFLLALAGVVVIQGFDPRVPFEFMIIGLGASLFAGLAYNIVRKLKKSEPALVIVFYFPLVTLPVTGIYLLFDWVTPTLNEWLLLLVIGVLVQFAQYFMTRAYQEEELSKAVSIKYFSIIYALIFGYVFFGETFTWETYAGMLLVMLGVGLNIWYKQRQESLTQDTRRNKNQGDTSSKKKMSYREGSSETPV